MTAMIQCMYAQGFKLETGIRERNQKQNMQEDISDRKLIFFPFHFLLLRDPMQ